ncbi:MAG TPA: glycosyltransferase family 87 protein [Bryobacteraceae bacterium]|jgi:hypothetical protein|nr:glycosyltransferase family 87 protein [Bryobacteraceae bacterium]
MTRIQDRISLERWTVAALVAVLAALIAAVAGVAFGAPLRVSLPVALVLGLSSCAWIARRLPREWDGARRTHTASSLLFLVVALAALARTAGVAWFMADASHPQASVYWFDRFYKAHSCYSGYWRAAEVARAGVPNLYDTAHYNGFIDRRFQVDEFLYVPQFLILPRIGLALGGDFYKIRAAWFAFEAALLFAATLALCRWIGGAAGRRAALLLAALWLSSPILATLQIGNYQVAAIALSMLAMVSFERGRPALGGALLAVAAFKLFPALLCLYLAGARRWRAVGWTIAFSLLYCLIAWLWMGGQPFVAFLHYDLPRVVSGDAWPFLADPRVTAINDSIPGLVLKLKAFGVQGMTRSLENIVGWVWTAIVVILAVLAGRRSPQLSRLERVCCWLALLALAAFRNRFMPDMYGLVAPIWLWTFIAAAAIAAAAPSTWRNAIWLAFAWLALSAVLPFHGIPFVANTRLLVSTVSQLLAIALCLWVLSRFFYRSRETTTGIVEMATQPEAKLSV